jgi:hypothetical protein
VIDWHALDMELERGKRDFERRMEETGNEVRERLERAERCCKEAEEERRRSWEEFEGRVMTAHEKHQFELDGIQRLFATMTTEYVKVVQAVGEDMRRGFAEDREAAREENRPHTEALLKMLDRLPPD